MSNNIEQIKSKVSDAKNQIEESKQLSVEDKMAKARELEVTISQIKTDLDALKVDPKAEDLSEIQTLESEYESLDSQFQTEFKQALQDLETEVKDDADEKDKEPNSDEKKKSWLWKQFEWLVSKEEWKDNTWTNIARAVGGVWAIRLWWKIIKWIWNLFKRKNKSDENESNNSNNKPRYKKWRGMWIIGVGWFFGIKWLLDYFSNKTEKWKESVDQISSYEELSEEQKLQYEKIWKNTNDFYWEIWKKETDQWYYDQNYLWKISENIKFKNWEDPKKYAGLVPYCIDKDADNIWELLSERDINQYLFSKNYKELKLQIKNRSTDKLEKVLWPFVTQLSSFEVFWTNPWKKLWDNIKDWLDDDESTKEREEELIFFFRQYTKVLTYTNDRKTSLEYKIATEAIKSKWYDWDSRPEDEEDQFKLIKNALEDEERFETEIKNNSLYLSFLSSNLLWVWSILEPNWLLNWNMSGLLSNEVIWPLDEESDDILKYDEDSKQTIIDKWISEIDSWLTNWTKDGLIDTCDDLRDNMVDEQWTWFMQENLEWISYMANLDDSNKDLFLKETGLDKFANKYIESINIIREKIKSWTATKEDLENLKKASTEYFAFKKELNLAIYTFSQIRSDNPDMITRCINTVYKMFIWLAESLSDIFTGKWTFWDWINVWVTGTFIVWWVYVFRHPRKSLKKVAHWTRHWITWVAWRPSLSYFWLRQKIKSLSNFSDKKSFFQHYLFNWKINSKKRILRLADDIWIRANTIDDLLKKLWAPSDYVDQIWKYRGNKNLRKLMIKQEISSHTRINDKLFHRKSSKVFDFNTDALKKIKSIDVISDANPRYSKSINRLLKNMKTLDDLDNLKLLVSDQKFLSKIENLNIFQLKKISKSIGKAWFTVDWIDDIIRWSDNIDAITRTRFNSIIDDEIEIMKKSFVSADSKIMKWKINQLENLKSSNKVTKESMETFIKLETKWIKPRHFPDIGDRLKQDKKLLQALDNWNFDEFSRLAKNNSKLKNVNKILWEFDLVLKKWWKYIDELADIIKGLWRIMKLI